MDRHHDARGGIESANRDKIEEVYVKIESTLRFSQNPSFSDQQVSYLEDLLANNLLSIVVHARSGHRCSECFNVVDEVLDRIHQLRKGLRQ